ncbi:hypothetical protein SAMN04487843_13318 [Methylobacterium sp. ap11]|uniref:DUF6468 domain-containing protein n=1 Tax=Methylobacterium sp. ap11 TaxID=1761799 RepID=UPI0008C045A2|nr:DUF6468 domain-containing protein [Methylobacterium sp. ap11]SEP49916.1 hypothetical protein SAMN04487843_13318 [Methylobacterium sp. ap11]
MSLIVSILADLLVAVLLVACISTSVGLGRRITRLKGDEAAMRQTIGDLMVATESAERAISGLRSTLAECDRTLAERLRIAERTNADLATQLRAGDEVLSRIGGILAQARASVPGEAAGMTPAAQAAMVQAAFAPAPGPTAAPAAVQVPPRAVPPEAAPASAAEPRPVSTGERLGAAAAAARALSERALSRLQAQAA